MHKHAYIFKLKLEPIKFFFKLKPCSHIKSASASTSKFPTKYNIASMVIQTQMQRIGSEPFLDVWSKHRYQVWTLWVVVTEPTVCVKRKCTRLYFQYLLSYQLLWYFADTLWCTYICDTDTNFMRCNSVISQFTSDEIMSRLTLCFWNFTTDHYLFLSVQLNSLLITHQWP